MTTKTLAKLLEANGISLNELDPKNIEIQQEAYCTRVTITHINGGNGKTPKIKHGERKLNRCLRFFNCGNAIKYRNSDFQPYETITLFCKKCNRWTLPYNKGPVIYCCVCKSSDEDVKIFHHNINKPSDRTVIFTKHRLENKYIYGRKIINEN